MQQESTTRILIIDDFFGREILHGRHLERESLCRRLGLLEFMQKAKLPPGKVSPLGRVRFFRGQKPQRAQIGDTVENDLPGCINAVSAAAPDGEPWDMLLLDLCFYTGEVTEESNSSFVGFPEGRPGDDDPDCFFGIDILKAVKQCHPMLPVVVFSAHSGERIESAVRDSGALRLIARDDPNARDRLAEVIAQIGKSRPHLSGGEVRDCHELLEIARSLPVPTIHEMRGLLRLLSEIECVLLKRALQGAFSRHYDEKSGVSLLPSLKLLTGLENITTSQAADWVKRLVHHVRPHQKVLMSDQQIKEAYEKSMRLRPGKGRKSDHD